VKQEQERDEMGDEWENKNLVFSDLKGGYFNPSYLLRAFGKILCDLGLPHMRIHDLRHSAASILLAKGVNIKVISELLGHSDIVVTLRVYGHLLPTMQGDVVDAWEEEFQDDEDEESENEG
jgi:integrase